MIADQFQENLECHLAMADMVAPPPKENEWAYFWTVLLAGAVGGAYIYSQGHK